MNDWKPNTAGTFYGLPPETYHAAPGVSNSMLQAMQPTPSHLTAYLSAKREPTDAMILGTLLHAMVLEPGKPLNLAVKPEGMSFATKDGKLWREQRRSTGCTIITHEEFQALSGMRDSVLGNPRVLDLMGDCSTEVSVFWPAALGVVGPMRKARIDIVPGGNALGDLKTCVSASPEAFAKLLADGYARQAAYYLDLWNDANPGDERTQFVFIAVESNPPYACATYRVHPDALVKAREWNSDALETYARCLARGVWPGYPEQFVTLDLPQWAYRN